MNEMLQKMRINLILFVFLATIALIAGLNILESESADMLVSSYFVLLTACVRSVDKPEKEGTA